MSQENSTMTSSQLIRDIELLVQLPVKININVLGKVPAEHVNSAWYSKVLS